jgi:hypothetical protein
MGTGLTRIGSPGEGAVLSIASAEQIGLPTYRGIG